MKMGSLAAVCAALLIISCSEIREYDIFIADEDDEFINYREMGIKKYLRKKKHVLIPNEIDGRHVKAIGRRAFFNKKIKEVIIPNGIKYIGESAFYRNELSSIVIPSSVTFIDERAFHVNPIVKITIGDNVNLYNAFERNNFYYTYKDNWKRAGTYILENDEWKYYVDEEYSIDENGIITNYGGNETSLEIPSYINGFPVTGIGKMAFREKKLTYVTIPNTVKKIDAFAFCNNNLTRVSIPDGVIFIDDSAFMDNDLKFVDIPYSVTRIENSAFANNKLTSVSIPDSVFFIGKNAFKNNLLRTVKIGSEIITINEGVFADNQLEKINLPRNLDSIGNSAFKNNMLTEINIPGRVYIIGDNAFAYNHLNTVILGAGVQTVGNYAFMNRNTYEYHITKVIVRGSQTRFEGTSLRNSVNSKEDFSEYYYEDDEYYDLEPSNDPDDNFDLFFKYNERKPGEYVYENGKWSFIAPR